VARVVVVGSLNVDHTVRVERFPAIVGNDIYGGDLFEQGTAQYRKAA